MDQGSVSYGTILNALIRERERRKIRVGLVTPGICIGGAEVWILSLLRFCDSTKIDWVGVAVLYPSNVDASMVDSFSRHVPLTYGPSAVDDLYRQCDVILDWGVLGDHPMPKKPRKTKVIVVSHGMGAWTQRVIAKAGDGDCQAAVSQAALLPFPKELHSKVKVIGNCYDPERLTRTATREETRRGWGIADGEKVVGYLGRLSGEKNPLAMIDTAKSLPSGYRIVLVGKGRMEQELRQVARGLPVVFAGPTNKPGDALAAFDWFALLSHEEGCSIALIEAWVSGVPAIATPVGVALEHRNIVRLLPPNPTGDQVADAIAADVNNPDEMLARITIAKKTAVDTYSPETFGRNWTNLICRML